MIVTNKIVERADELGEKIYDWLDTKIMAAIEKSKKAVILSKLERFDTNDNTAQLVEDLTGDHLDNLITNEAKEKILNLV